MIAATRAASSGWTIRSQNVTSSRQRSTGYPSTSTAAGLTYSISDARVVPGTTHSEYTIAGACSTRLRKRASASCAARSASRREVTSIRNPWKYATSPSASNTAVVASCTQIHRPSACRMRYSPSNGSVFVTFSSPVRRRSARSSGCISDAHRVWSSTKRSAGTPSSSSICGLTNVIRAVGPSVPSAGSST